MAERSTTRQPEEVCDRGRDLALGGQPVVDEDLPEPATSGGSRRLGVERRLQIRRADQPAADEDLAELAALVTVDSVDLEVAVDFFVREGGGERAGVELAVPGQGLRWVETHL